MSIRRTGARRIIVDAVPYKWRVRPRPSGDPPANLTLAIEQERTKGAVLVITLSASRPDCHHPNRPPSAVVLPADVAGYIRLARSSGWVPDRPGRPFRLQVPSTERMPKDSRPKQDFVREEIDRRCVLESLIQKLQNAANEEQRGELSDGETFMNDLIDRLEKKR